MTLHQVARAWLHELYADYAKRGRSLEWAISLETAELLVEQLEQIDVSPNPERPIMLIDCGSGFSSLVLRRWAVDVAQRLVVIISTDLEPRYLEQTCLDAAVMGLPTHSFIMHHSLDTVALTEHWSTELLVWDLGKRSDRMRYFERIVEKIRPRKMLLDDMNRMPDAKWLRWRLERNGYDVEPRPDRIDQHGRFPAIATRKVAS